MFDCVHKLKQNLEEFKWFQYIWRSSMLWRLQVFKGVFGALIPFIISLILDMTRGNKYTEIIISKNKLSAFLNYIDSQWEKPTQESKLEFIWPAPLYDKNMTDRRSSYLNLISSTKNQCEPFHKNVLEYLNTLCINLVSTYEERAKLSK